ncbi:DUF4406 domain-containing protein [bacterium]|jgi:hypothetical protein|nr:DUF4406 domain-containing protein [bacterium]
MKKEELIIFISGQCTDKGYVQAEIDFKITEELLIKTNNYKKVINVFDLVDVVDEKTWKDYMIETYKYLLDCNAIYMQNGWEKSKGAQIELHIARTLGYTIIFEDEQDNNTYLYQFRYNCDINESVAGTISTHHSEEGAIKAMNEHKEIEYNEWLRYDSECKKMDPEWFEEHPNEFGRYETWGINKIIVLP